MNNIDIVNKLGYLNEDFQFFHLEDRTNQQFESHYHEFNKIIIFLSGKVTYFIEGKTYNLEPWDILLINNFDVHRPMIDPSTPYERIVIWVNRRFIEYYNYEGCNLLTCFNLTNKQNSNLIRLNKEMQKHLQSLINSLEISFKSKEFGSNLLSNTILIQFLIYLNRIRLKNLCLNDENSFEYDKQVTEAIDYINSNLTKDLSIETVSKELYISKYYLMRKFKKKTGYTLHNYVLQKRLQLAKTLITSGEHTTKAALDCGFNDYSSFVRAFKKYYNKTPRDYYVKL